MSSLSLKRTATAANGSNNEPVPKLGKRAPVPLMELDLEKLEVGSKVEQGSQGDRFVRLNYEGSRLEIALKKLPNWARAPFAAGPPLPPQSRSKTAAAPMPEPMHMDTTP